MFAWTVVLAGLVLGIGAATALGGGGNSADAQLCQQNGWMNLLRSDGTTFSNTGDCVSYGAHGGTLHPLFVFTAELNGSSQNPPVATPGTGTVTVTWNTVTNAMTVDVTFSGLTTGTTASHVHCCVTPPGNAGVATTVPTFPGFPLGVTAGTYSHTFDMTNQASYNPAFVAANGGTAASAEQALLAGLLAGQAYLNIHTKMFPGGEIRGFLQQP
jgi:hypothetical protein